MIEITNITMANFLRSPRLGPKSGKIIIVRLQLHGAIYRSDSFVLMLLYCANLKAIRCESTSLNRIGADKSHRVIVALIDQKVSGFDKVKTNKIYSKAFTELHVSEETLLPTTLTGSTISTDFFLAVLPHWAAQDVPFFRVYFSVKIPEPC